MTDNNFREIFDAISSPVLVVDDDVKIIECNCAAAALFGCEKADVLKQRGGEALQCIYSQQTSEGCGGTPVCKDCVIRNSVKEASTQKRVVRYQHKLEVESTGVTQDIHVLITVAPFVFDGTPRILLTIEDMTEFVQLQRLVPICSWCRKVRTNKDTWILLESYFRHQLDLNFTHGICPACQKEQLEEHNQTKNQKRSKPRARQ